MDGHTYVKGTNYGGGREDKMYFHVFTEYNSIHDEIFTFDSKYYDDLRREAEKLGANKRIEPVIYPRLKLVVDNTRHSLLK